MFVMVEIAIFLAKPARQVSGITLERAHLVMEDVQDVGEVALGSVIAVQVEEVLTEQIALAVFLVVLFALLHQLAKDAAQISSFLLLRPLVHLQHAQILRQLSTPLAR